MLQHKPGTFTLWSKEKTYTPTAGSMENYFFFSPPTHHSCGLNFQIPFRTAIIITLKFPCCFSLGIKILPGVCNELR